MATVVVSGMICGQPGHGGAAWAVLQYLHGLARLGHEVYFIEPLPQFDGQSSDVPLDATESGAYFVEVMRAFPAGLARSALVRLADRETLGLSFGEVVTVCRRADLLINLSGILRDPELIGPIPRRMYLDLDPAFTQLWHWAEDVDMGFDNHTHFVTVGLEVGQPTNSIPTCGVRWNTTLPPVVLDLWPRAGPPERDVWTTVANWRSYGTIRYDGHVYGQKAHAFRELLDLPRLTGDKFELALRIDPGDEVDRQRLQEHDWHLLDPDREVATPLRYQQFIKGSAAELAVAKAGYVASNSGWFSERSAEYLASGRPVVAANTGFASHLPTGQGLLTFSSTQEAAETVMEVRRRYDYHSQGAREIAMEFLDSDRVLTRLLAIAGL